MIKIDNSYLDINYDIKIHTLKYPFASNDNKGQSYTVLIAFQDRVTVRQKRSSDIVIINSVHFYHLIEKNKRSSIPS